jgi:hypothetical protein
MYVMICRVMGEWRVGGKQLSKFFLELVHNVLLFLQKSFDGINLICYVVNAFELLDFYMELILNEAGCLFF